MDLGEIIVLWQPKNDRDSWFPTIIRNTDPPINFIWEVYSS